MSTTSNQSPVSGCTFGSLQSAGAGTGAGTYQGSCAAGNAQYSSAFATDVLHQGCTQASTVCTDTLDGYCVNSWTYYNCQAPITPCGGA